MEEKKKHLAVEMAETMVIGANEDLGITQEYNGQNRKKLWDSKEAKSAYKEKVFNGKRTYRDPVTGKELHIAEKAARNKFHMKTADGKNNSTAWAAHSAEADHIVSLKELHGRVKSNAFLTDRDLKEIANQDANFRATSKHFNAQKQEKSDLAMAMDRDSELSREGKIALVKGKIGAEVHVNADIALHMAKNMGTEFATGATEALTGALIPLTVEAVSQMCKVASGEKSLGEAAGDMAKYTVGTAVVGGARRLIVDQANFMMANIENPLFQKIASSGQIGQITAVALIVADSAERYLNGEISGQEFIEEIGQKGTMMVAGMIGGEIGSEIGTFLGLASGGLVGAAAGKVIGKVLGTVITTAACSGIILVSSAVKDIRETAKHLDDYRKKERELAMIRTEALAEMERQREKFKAICAEEFGRWDETFAEGFDRIMESACEGVYSAKGVAEGLDEILRIFGRNVRFGTVEEYEAQLDSALVLQF